MAPSRMELTLESGPRRAWKAPTAADENWRLARGGGPPAETTASRHSRVRTSPVSPRWPVRIGRRRPTSRCPIPGRARRSAGGAAVGVVRGARMNGGPRRRPGTPGRSPFRRRGPGPAHFRPGSSCGASLVRRKKSAAHENADHHHQGRPGTIFTMHFCSHTPGSMARLSHEAGTACLPCSQSCYEARPRRANGPTLARYPGNILRICIYPENSPQEPGLAASQLAGIQPQAPRRRTTASPHLITHLKCHFCRTAHGGNTGLQAWL